jgi:hypothetical protein
VAKTKTHGASDPRAVMPPEERAGFAPPDAVAPFWRYPSGERLSVRLLLAGQPRERAELIVEAHADAVRELAWAAGTALVRGDMTELRRLAAGASRLCRELAGAGSREKDASPRGVSAPAEH